MTIIPRNWLQIIFSILFISFTVVASAGYVFNSQDATVMSEPVKKTTIIKKERRFKRFVKKMAQKIQKVKKRVLPKTIFRTSGKDNKDGTTALFSLLTSIFVRVWGIFTSTSGLFIVLGFLLLLVALIYSAKGKKKDTNPKRAKAIFIISMIILVLNLAGLVLLL